MKRILSFVWYRLLFGAVLGGWLGVLFLFVFYLTQRPNEVFWSIDIQGSFTPEQVQKLHERAAAEAHQMMWGMDRFTRYVLGFVFVLMCILAGMLIAGFAGVARNSTNPGSQ